MITSTKRLIMGCIGLSMAVGYIIYEDTHIFEMEIHQYFMIAVVGFFTILNFGRYVMEKGKENYESR